MATVKEIYTYLDHLAPFSLQMDFDNAGFLAGRTDANVERILISLDITEEVVLEAVEQNSQLIVSHHPLIFHPIRSITDQDPTGKCLLKLIENGISAICAHTNLDVVEGGVNDALARALRLSEIELLHEDGLDPNGRPYGIGRIGNVETSSNAKEFGLFVQKCLHAEGLRLEDAGKPVKRVAVGGGACGEYLREAVRKGCDTFVTADVKYNTFLDARALGINLIDAGHFSTENVICPVLADQLRCGFDEVEVLISQTHKEVFSCI